MSNDEDELSALEILMGGRPGPDGGNYSSGSRGASSNTEGSGGGLIAVLLSIVAITLWWSCKAIFYFLMWTLDMLVTRGRGRIRR